MRSVYNYRIFLDDLKKKKKLKKRLLVLNGTQMSIKQEIIDRLKEYILQEPMMNFQMLNEEEMDSLEEAIGTFPFLDENRLVVFQASGIVDNKAGEGNENRKEKLKRLIEICRYIPDTAYLVLLTEKLDRRSKISREETLYGFFCDKGLIVEAKPLKEEEMQRWLRTYWGERKKLINIQSITLLNQLYGNDLTIMKREMEKLELYLGDKNDITVADIEAICGNQVELNNFRFLDFIRAKRLDDALLHLHILKEMNQSPSKIFALLRSDLTRFWKIKNCLDRGMSKEEIKKECGISYDFMIEKVEREKDNFLPEKMNSIWHALVETDKARKSSGHNEWYLLENLIVKIIKG